MYGTCEMSHFYRKASNGMELSSDGRFCPVMWPFRCENFIVCEEIYSSMVHRVESELKSGAKMEMFARLQARRRDKFAKISHLSITSTLLPYSRSVDPRAHNTDCIALNRYTSTYKFVLVQSLCSPQF